MNQEEIKQLAALSRIAVTPDTITRFEKEMTSILEYVGQVKDLTLEPKEPAVGPRYNVMRSDEVTNAPDQYTDVIMREMPQTDGRYLKVKKIITSESS